MKTSNLTPSFTELSLKFQSKTARPNQKAISISNELDKTSNKYSDGSWKTEPVTSHYRNTFVEQQKENYLKRLNLV